MATKSKKSRTIGFVIMILVSGLFGFLIGKFGFEAGKNMPDGVVPLIAFSFIPVFFLVIGFHEAGHAVAGVWQKFDFRMYVVGPFMWDREQDSWKFKWNKNVNTAGGMVICMPTGTENLKNRFSIYAAGGPIASLILAGLCYLFYALLPNASHFGLLFLLIAFFSLLIFAVTIIPLHLGGFTSDGGRILNLQRGGEASRFEILLLSIISKSTGGVRPSLLDWNELEEAYELAQKLKVPFGVYIHGLFHQAAWDRGDIDLAEKHLLNYISEIENIPEGIRNVVWLDAAFFYAFAKHDLPNTLNYWNRFKPSAIIPRAQILATEAAISRLKSENEAVLIKTKSALKELPNMLDKGVAISLREKLIQLQS
jgi:Peptidase family M50